MPLSPTPGRARRLGWTALAAAALSAGLGLALRERPGPVDLAPAVPGGETDYYQPHPVLGHAHRPQARRATAWPEHPAGRIVMRTNGLGLREDREIAPEGAPGVRRVLVVGDSHTDGVVENPESFPHVLEAALIARGEAVQILNAGVGHYGPDQYAKALEVWGALAPDALLVALYTGNDLLDTLAAREAAGALGVPRPPDYYERLREAEAILGPGLAQGFNQVYAFARMPPMADRAAALTRDALGALARDAARRGVALLVVALPTRLDVEPEAVGDALPRSLAAAGLTDADLRAHRRAVTSLVASLPEAGVPTLSLLDGLACPGAPCFWALDHHLSVAGHQAVADGILARAPLGFLTPSTPPQP